MSFKSSKNLQSEYAISEELLIKMHTPRFELKDSTVLVFQILFWLVPNLILDAYSFYETSFAIKTYYLTQIGVTLVSISWLISTYITYLKTSGQEISTRLRRINHLWFEVTFTIQVLITIVYWGVLHHQLGDFIKSKGPYFIYYMIWLHSVPMVCIGTEFALTSQIVFMRDYKYILGFGLVYCLNNFLQTKLCSGRRPYPFMKWDELDSLVSAVVIVLFFTFKYFIVAKLTQRFSKDCKIKVKNS